MRHGTSTALRIVLLTIVFGLGSVAWGEDAGSRDERKLFREGARLWPQACGNCHKPRPPGERSPAEWDTILMHMRVRANLPAAQAEAILAFLKAR